MKRFFIAFLLVLTTAFSVTAQIMDPVKWTFAINDLNDEEFELVATATIEPAYHVYSTTMPDMAPLPTVFSFEATEYYEPVGEGYDLTEAPLFTTTFLKWNTNNLPTRLRLDRSSRSSRTVLSSWWVR